MPDRLSAPAFIFMTARVSAIIEISADRFRNAPVAQLDRASGYEPEGREFESLRAHHLSLQFRASFEGPLWLFSGIVREAENF